MSKLSLASIKLLQAIQDTPGLDGLQLKERFGTQTPNNLKMLEQYGYVEYIGPANGWTLTGQGKNVLKYG